MRYVKKMNVKIKGKIYKTEVRTAMLYVTKIWASKMNRL